jgi:hypothetical protein
VVLAGKGGEKEAREVPLVFGTEKACEVSASLREAPTMLNEQWVKSVVDAWKKEWEGVEK